MQSAYLRMAGCRFAQPYLEGRSVAYLEGEEPGHVSPRLIEASGSLTILHESDSYPGPADKEVRHQRVMLPDLPYPDGYFGAVVAFGVVEGRKDPGALIREVARVLGEEGTLLLCTPDKQAYSNDRNLRDPGHRRTLHVPELRQLLEEHFRGVRLYRAGAVAGGLVSELEEGVSSGPVETSGVPAGDFILAICGAEEAGEGPRLTLDEEGLAFEELEEARQEAELLRAEIRQMQQTEVQSFRDALKLERERVSRLGSDLENSQRRLGELQGRLEDREASSKRLSDENAGLKARDGRLREHLRQIEESRTWRMLGLYRRLREALRGTDGQGR